MAVMDDRPGEGIVSDAWGPAPFGLPGWIEYAQERWGLRAETLRFARSEPQGAHLECVVYSDARGRLRMPPHNAYLSLRYTPSPSPSRRRAESHWLELAEQLAAELAGRRSRGPLCLPPAVADVRPWQWAGYEAVACYTYLLDLPADLSASRSEHRRKLRRAGERGFVCERTADVDAVVDCIRATEQRQGFTHDLSAGDLERLLGLIGDEACLLYLCRAPDGTPAAARVVLAAPGGSAIGWASGTCAKYLPAHAGALLEAHAFEDLGACGVRVFDFGGANQRHTALAKVAWGARLQAFFVVTPLDLHRLATQAVGLAGRRGRRGPGRRGASG
jgi:hypothetical protein